MALEKLSYKVLETDGAFQLRAIPAHVLAETFAEGEFEKVGNTGFRRLVAYIGGANESRSKLAMTAPVAQSGPPQKLAMTAPVGQSRDGDRYRITFLMPKAFALHALPVPTDARVRLVEEPERTVAAVRYRGVWTKSRYDEFEDQLRAWIASKDLTANGEPVWARYHPPFMPWFLRRNEIMIEVARSSA
jgi:hypothetical protein